MRFGWLACFSCALGWLAWSTANCRADELLSVGSKAPELNIEHWINQSDHALKPVTKFQPGKIYVVEFWATWCGPCIQGMPHLAELQAEYAEKGVQIIGVSSEDLETVEEFLARPIPKRATDKVTKEQTFGDLTKGYSLSCDPDESTEKSYMQAAYQSVLPTAFIVGKDAKIEWIGHPENINDVLRAITSDSWDRERFGKEFLAVQKSEIAKAQLNTALQKRDYAKANELIDQRIVALEEAQEKLELRLMKVQISLAQNKVEDATSRLRECYAAAQDQVAMIDLISWHIYEQSEQRRIPMTSLLKVAYSESEKAVATAKGEALGSLLDTVAHLAYKLGDLDKAIKLVTQATEHAAGENKEFSKQFLEQLKAEKSQQAESSGKPAAADQSKAKK